MLEAAFGEELERGVLQIGRSSEATVCLMTSGGYPLVIINVDEGAFEAYLGDDDRDPPFARGTLGDVLRALRDPISEWVERRVT